MDDNTPDCVLYAIAGGSRVTADPKYRNSQSLCPCCDSSVLPKCGEIKTWHWAHRVGAECDQWHAGETEWHREWKSLFPADCVEVPLGPHRADVKIDGLVIEFQNSPISTVEIKDREQFYGEMFWVFNASDWDITEHTTKLGKPCWKWRHPHRSLTAVNSPLFIDFRGTFCFVHEIDWDLSLLSVAEVPKTEFVRNPREALKATRIALAEKAEKERLQEIEHERQRREEQLRLEAQREKARQEAMVTQQKIEAERAERAREALERKLIEQEERDRRQAELEKKNTEADQKNQATREAEERERERLRPQKCKSAILTHKNGQVYNWRVPIVFQLDDDRLIRVVGDAIPGQDPNFIWNVKGMFESVVPA